MPENDNDNFQDPAQFARGIAGPLGKLDHDLKTKVDEHTHTLFLQQCSMRGIDPSCAIRDCVYLMVHGKSYRQMVMEKVSHDEKRIEALTKLIGSFGALELGGAKHG